MRLTDLEGQLYRYAGKQTFAPAKTIAKADSVMFLCPACFVANGGPHGTHSIRVDFAGKGVPDDACIRNDKGKPVRWKVTGSNVRDITLSPSILLLSGCAWHGFVRNGEVTDA